MKNLFKSILAVLIMVTTALGASAQINQQSMFKKRAKEAVGSMNTYIKTMVQRGLTVEKRERNKRAALTLFIGKGYEYYKNNVRNEGVNMQTTSINGLGQTTIKDALMRKYFDNLINLVLNGTYTEVNIETTETYDMEVSQARQVGENLWECTVTFRQTFEGKNGEIIRYGDVTYKTVKVYMEKIRTDAGDEFKCMLGDVKAGETQRL